MHLLEEENLQKLITVGAYFIDDALWCLAQLVRLSSKEPFKLNLLLRFFYGNK